MRFFVHYTPFDETFDPHALTAEYGTALLDRDGKPIATTPQVPGYVLDPCVARYTTNPLNVATIGVQTLMPPEQRGDIALQATYRRALLTRLLTTMNEEFQRFLPPDKRDADLALQLDYMTVFLTTETTDDTRAAFPAADFLRMRVVNTRNACRGGQRFRRQRVVHLPGHGFLSLPADPEEESRRDDQYRGVR